MVGTLKVDYRQSLRHTVGLTVRSERVGDGHVVTHCLGVVARLIMLEDGQLETQARGDDTVSA